jgi:2-oxoisovalerate dehydrogenase E1 component alpha subunit
MTSVAGCEVPCVRFLTPEGRVERALPTFAQDREALTGLYRAMLRARAFDEKAVALQRTGRLGTFPSALGQEAVAVGIAAAMGSDDVFLPSFREHGAQLLRGATPAELLLYWGGDERGNSPAACPQDFPICVPVGSQVPHAVGVALAFALRREPRVALAVLGDGATSKGDVAEALDIAGVWRVPAVFVVCNNRWAISTPVAAQTAAATLAMKAVAAGIPAIRVDGNDVIAVREVVAQALAAARAGAGPRLVEALTYRLADHTTADDSRRYRDDGEVSAHWSEEPIARLRGHLHAAGLWSAADEQRLVHALTDEMDKAAAAYLATPPQPPETIFDFTYATLPADLMRQRDAAKGGKAP